MPVGRRAERAVSWRHRVSACPAASLPCSPGMSWFRSRLFCPSSVRAAPSRPATPRRAPAEPWSSPSQAAAGARPSRPVQAGGTQRCRVRGVAGRDRGRPRGRARAAPVEWLAQPVKRRRRRSRLLGAHLTLVTSKGRRSSRRIRTWLEAARAGVDPRSLQSPLQFDDHAVEVP